jgi:hypothetical protein
MPSSRVVAYLLCFCLFWIATSFASSLMVRKEIAKRPVPPFLTSSDVSQGRLRKALEDLGLLPNVIIGIVVSYLSRQFYAEPYLIKELQFESRSSVRTFFHNNDLFVGALSDDKRSLTTNSCNLLDTESEVMVLSTHQGLDDLITFNLYPEVHIFVNKKGRITLKGTDGKEMPKVSDSFARSDYRVKMAPKEANNFVYLFNIEELILINLKYMTSAKFKPEGNDTYFLNVSLNEAGTLLAYSDNCSNVKILRVQCDAKGKIDPVEYIVTMNLTGYSVVFLKGNILALRSGNLHTFYNIHENDQRVDSLDDKFNSTGDFYDLSYNAAEDMVFAFVRNLENVSSRAAVSIESFFGDTRILIINPNKIWGLEYSDYKVSHDLTYLLRDWGSSFYIYRLLEDSKEATDRKQKF